MNYLMSLCLAILFVSFQSFAEEGPCKADREKFCKGIKGGGGAIVKCLKEHEADLSTTCKDFHAKMKTERKEARAACHEDAQKLCADKKGRDRAHCLREKKDQASEECKKEIEDIRKEIKK